MRVFVLLVAMVAALVRHAAADPSPPAPCGTLDLTSPLTQHCFPEDGEDALQTVSLRPFRGYPLLAGSPAPPPWAPHAILSNNAAQYCPAGSHHFVCCEQIALPDNPDSPHGNQNPLGRVIREASQPENYSWCTCSEEICTQQLGGRVAWNQHGSGWSGYRPSQRGAVLNALTGLGQGSAAAAAGRRDEFL